MLYVKDKTPTEGFQTEEMESFPAGENPFIHDSYHMGVFVGTNPLVMYESHKDNRYIIIVDRRTGKRLRVDMPRPPMTDAELSG